MKRDPRLKDFRNFLFLVWKHLGLPEPTPIQYEIADYLQHGPRRCCIQAFRGVGKSWMTVAYVLWRLYWDPQLKVLVVSASKPSADNFSTFCLQLINSMPLLAHLQPSVDQRNAKHQFDVGPSLDSKDPSVRSLGITSQLTGGRADLIIPDDVESANNSLTQGARDKLAEAIKEFDAILKPGGEIRYLGTPQTEMSIYNLLPQRGYEIRVWPARYPTKAQAVRYGTRLAPSILQKLEDDGVEGTSTDPRRFSDSDLLEREASYGRSGFALQFMLDTSLSDAERYPLRLSDLLVMDVNLELAPEKLVWANDPRLSWGETIPCVGFTGDRLVRPLEVVGKWIPYTGSVLAIDPAGRGSDELGYCVAKTCNGNIYLAAFGGLLGGYTPENLAKLAQLAQAHKVNLCVIESNFGDGMFTELFKPVLSKFHTCTVEEVRHSTQKERRIIDTLEPVMNQHRLIVDAKALQADFESVSGYQVERRGEYRFTHQLTRITKERGALCHDDRLDAVAIAVNYWTQQMALDADKRIDLRKERDLKRELANFSRHVFGHRPAPSGWLQKRLRN